MTTAQVEKKVELTEEQIAAKAQEAKKLLGELLEAGVHLGNEPSQWNPKMAEYIHSTQNGIHILDLPKTVNNLMTAADYLKRQAKTGRNILFVGTSKQCSEIVKEEATRAEVFYINQRWLGGLVTNFETIRGRLAKLRELENMEEAGGFEGLGKKEIAQLKRLTAKLEKSLGGLKKMRGRPEVIVIFDQNKDSLAVTESKKQNVTLIALADTDCDPTGIDHVIPANDNSMKSVSAVAKYLADAIVEGAASAPKRRKI